MFVESARCTTPPQASSRRALRTTFATLAFLALACGSPDPLEEALRLQAQGNYQASIEPLRALLEANPDDTQVNYLYGRALTVTGQPSLGEWALRRAARDPEWLVPAGTQLAVSALRTGNFETAVEQTTRVLEAEPENLDALLIRAQAYARSRRFTEEAIADAERILEIDPGNTDAMEPRIQALLTLERIDEAEAAIGELGRMIDEDPDASEWIRGWHCATTALFAADSDEDELARERWEACLERHPAHANVVSSALGFFDGRDDYARSLELLRAAVEAEPQSIDLRRRLALRTRYAEGNEAAEEVLVAGAEVAEPQHRPTALHVLAKHYQDLGDHERAVEAMVGATDASRELGSVPPQLLFDLADAMILKGDHEGALAVTEEMSVAPHREMIRARVAQERSDHEAALAHYDEAFRLWPDNPWARYLAARSAEASGQFDRAIELYRYSIRIDSGATDARYRLAQMLTDEGNPTEGLAMLSLDSANNPLTLEGELLALELNTWAGQQAPVADALQRFAGLGASAFGRALAAMGDGAQMRFGPDSAAQILERYQAGSLDVQDPARPEGLYKLIELRREAGDVGVLEPTIRAAVAANPQASGAHAALGRWLELTGAPEAETRAAFEKAVALDAANAYALRGLARLASGSSPEQAIAWLDRAAEADPEDVEARVEAARLLAAVGRRDAAAARLRAVIDEQPRAPTANALLAETQLEAGDVTDETEALAERAVRFAGGEAALELLARVYRKRENPEGATEIEARLRELRAIASAAQPPPEAETPPQ